MSDTMSENQQCRALVAIHLPPSPIDFSHPERGVSVQPDVPEGCEGLVQSVALFPLTDPLYPYSLVTFRNEQYTWEPFWVPDAKIAPLSPGAVG